MNSEKTAEEVSAEQPAKRRRYVAPKVTDCLQPVVVLGTATQTAICATPRPPKHP